MSLGLPSLALGHVMGVFAAELTWPLIDGPKALGLALACFAGALLSRRLPALRFGFAWGVAFAAGLAGLAARLDAAGLSVPTAPETLSLEAWVCAADGSGLLRSVELCAPVEVASPGALPGEGRALPPRLVVQHRAGSDEARALSSLQIGDRIRARVRVAPLGGLRNPGRLHPERRWQRRGIGGRASLLDTGLLVRVRAASGGPEIATGLGAWLEALRARLSARLRSGVGAGASPESGALLAALGVGDRAGLGISTRDAFASLGIAHLLAISGLHLALVAGLIYAGLRFLLSAWGDHGRDLRLVAGVGAGVAALGYAQLVGFGVPVQRALIFLAAGLVALRLGRSLPLGHLLSIAWLGVGLAAPQSLFELGPQLSFAATGALLMAARRPVSESEPQAHRLGRVITRVRLLVHLSALALISTAPLLAWRGLAAGAPGVLVNVLAIPWTSAFLLPASLLATAASGFEGSVAEGCLAISHSIAALTLAAVDGLSEVFAAGSGVRGRPHGIALGVAAVFAVQACRMGRTSAVLVIALSAVLWLRTAPPADRVPSPPRLVMFDVGQGDALLLQGARSAVLVDAARAIPGGLDLGRSTVVPALAALGVDHLDALVITHGDIDHRGGAISVLDALPVSEIWLPWRSANDPNFAGLRRSAGRHGVAIVEMGAGAPPRRIGALRATPLWPPREGPLVPANARSLVFRFELAGWRILLTGDIGAEVEAALQASGVDLAADLLKVGHHGSRGSSTPAFLSAVAPRWLLLSAPCHGGSRLPHPEALARFEATGVPLAWTGRDGAAVFDLGLGPTSESSAPRLKGVRPRSCTRAR